MHRLDRRRSTPPSRPRCARRHRGRAAPRAHPVRDAHAGEARRARPAESSRGPAVTGRPGPASRTAPVARGVAVVRAPLGVALAVAGRVRRRRPSATRAAGATTRYVSPAVRDDPVSRGRAVGGAPPRDRRRVRARRRRRRHVPADAVQVRRAAVRDARRRIRFSVIPSFSSTCRTQVPLRDDARGVERGERMLDSARAASVP